MKNKKWMGLFALLLMILSIMNISLSPVLANDGWTDPANDVRYFPTNNFGEFWEEGPLNASKTAESITEKWSKGTLTSMADGIDIRQVTLEGEGNMTLTVQFDGSMDDIDFIFIIIWADVNGSEFYGVLTLNSTRGIDATYSFRNDENKTRKGYLAFGDAEISAQFPAKWWGDNETEDTKTMNVLSGTITDENALYMDVFPNDLVGEGSSSSEVNSEEGPTSWISLISNNWFWISILIIAFLAFIVWVMMKQNRKIRHGFQDERIHYY